MSRSRNVGRNHFLLPRWEPSYFVAAIAIAMGDPTGWEGDPELAVPMYDIAK
jgi:hypothetical protein